MKNFIQQFGQALINCYYAPAFIREHQLWKGFQKHPLVVIMLIILAAVLGFQMLNTAFHFIKEIQTSGLAAMGLFGDFDQVINEVFRENIQNIYNGSIKYLVLICMELLIFHIVIRANEIINNNKEKLSSKMFIRAQFRMLKLTFFIYTLEIILSGLADIFLGMIKLEFLGGPVEFLIESFCMGFAIIDNYYELLKFKIKTSFKKVYKNFIGLAAGVGLVLHLFMYVPIVGPFAGTIIAAVAVAHLMNRWDPIYNYHPDKEYI